MRIPLQIVTTHHVSLTPNIDAEIRERAEQLSSFYDRIVRCRVAVSGPARHHRQGSFNIRVEVSVPGEEIVASRQTGEDLQMAVRDAFEAARRQLQDYARRQREPAPAVKRAREEEPGAGLPSMADVM